MKGRPALRTSLLCICALFFAGQSLADSAGLTVRVGNRELLVTGARPRASVVVIGVTREPRGFHSLVRTHALPPAVADSRGAVAIPFDAEIPAKSLWVAADVQTGMTGAGAPDGYPVRQFETAHVGVAAERVVLQRTALELLVIRPGSGVWSSSMNEGGRGDGDRTPDGRISILPVELAPVIGNGRMTDGFRPGDIVIALDPDQMEYGVIRVRGTGGGQP